MHTRPLTVALGLAAVVVAGAACRGPALDHPLVGQQRYLCCNTYYEKDTITDNPYQVGTKLPLGTRVEILEVRRNSVKFQPVGHPPITLVQKYGDKVLPFDQYLDRVFVDRDPHHRLDRRVAESTRGGRGKKGTVAPPKPSETVRLIEDGVVQPGMTREQVLMAIGYPPAHRTPSLEQSDWHYWRNRWDQFVVYFDGDRVARIGQ